MRFHKPLIVFLLTFLSLSTLSTSWFWSSPNPSSPSPGTPENLAISREIKGEFSVEAIDDERAIERVENAKRKLAGSKPCWHEAYRGIFAACSEITADDNEKRKRFAWDLSNCFQKDTGRSPFPTCRDKSPMKECLEKLDDDAIHTYREFFLETNSICHQLQSDIFRRQTERLVNDLKRSAENAEEKLETIEVKSSHLIQATDFIHNSLNSIHERTERLYQTTTKISDRISEISTLSEAVLVQSEKISASQTELHQDQQEMIKKIEEVAAELNQSYRDLEEEIDGLSDETAQIGKEITRVGDSMASKMEILQDKADGIGNLAGNSLEKQKELLQGQAQALGGLKLLGEFQSQALEESRVVTQKLANFGREQQEELLRRQEELQRAHDRLVENSKSMLAAQEAFERKQASMFIALDKLFALHNALLLESRLIKSFFLYSISMPVLYLLTSTKQTNTVRHRLYIGLCTAFSIEFAIIRYVTSGVQQQTWLINLCRSLYVLLASAQILHAVFMYRDYDMLNYSMLKNLTEEVSKMREKVQLCSETESEEEDWSSWVDADVPDGVENLKEMSYVIGHEEERVEEFSDVASSITSRYNLRSAQRPSKYKS